MSKRKQIPHFKTEADERAFWESHDSTEYLDWSSAIQVVMQNLQPTSEAKDSCDSEIGSCKSNERSQLYFVHKSLFVSG